MIGYGVHLNLMYIFFFSSRRRHTRLQGDWSSDVCSSDLAILALPLGFLGLALAAQNEPAIPMLLLVLFSPGLKLAELITPEHHASLGATFGWFLRIGIGVNALYYFLVFARSEERRVGKECRS